MRHKIKSCTRINKLNEINVLSKLSAVRGLQRGKNNENLPL